MRICRRIEKQQLEKIWGALLFFFLEEEALPKFGWGREKLIILIFFSPTWLCNSWAIKQVCSTHPFLFFSFPFSCRKKDINEKKKMKRMLMKFICYGLQRTKYRTYYNSWNTQKKDITHTHYNRWHKRKCMASFESCDAVAPNVKEMEGEFH